MTRSLEQLRRDALAIWHAAVRAVDSQRLVRDAIRLSGGDLIVADERMPLDRLRRIVIVGAGKAGAGMALGAEESLGPRLLAEKQVTGWINVPANCVRPTQVVHLHAARPAGLNEPTIEGVSGSAEILRMVEALGPDDLCLCLISGGGSALLPAPVKEITLADKQAITRFLSAAGANIAELNTVRKQLSRIKGNGLARACGAGRLIALVISDVLGDPLDIIASGPTVADHSTPSDALAVLRKYDAETANIAPRAVDYLAAHASGANVEPKCSVTNVVIGNNATAVDAAGIEADTRGYSPAMISARTLEGSAEEVGRHLAEMAMLMRSQVGPDCLISGGEPTVKLAAAEIRGRGGRNQQLVLAALEVLASRQGDGCLLLSGGTDGEDGPTDAAGAVVDPLLIHTAAERGLDASDFLRRNDAYCFFEPLDGLIRTGPTHTNVCDVRVAVVDRVERRK